MEAHAYHQPIQSGIVFLPSLHNQFDDSGNVNLNIPFLRHSFSLTGPSVPPPPPSGVLVHHNPTLPASALCPLNPALLIKVDEERSMSLHQLMADEGLVPLPKDESRRKVAIQKLKQIVSSWIKKVAQNRGLPRHQISVTSATILTYGSYGLGVHSAVGELGALDGGESAVGEGSGGNRWCRVYKELSLPSDSDPSDITTKFEAGTLEIKFPKLIATSSKSPERDGDADKNGAQLDDQEKPKINDQISDKSQKV